MFFRLVDFPLLRRLTKYVGITQAVCVVFLALTLACTGTQSQSEEGIGTAARPGSTGANAPPATPSATLTEAQLATRTVFIELFENAKPVVDAFRERRADTGGWNLNDGFGRPGSDDRPIVSVRDGEATMEVSCAPAEELQISFVRRKAFMTDTDIGLGILEDDGTEMRVFQWFNNNPGWHRTPTYSTAYIGTVIHHMGDDSQAIIDGMLLNGASEMKAGFGTGQGFNRDVRSHAFEITGYPVVHEILTSYCYLTPAEIQATIVAEALTAPTPTPVPPPTLTPTPLVTWQQEWCREQGTPHTGVEGHWDPLSGVEGTARLIVRCTGGILVVGIHITRSDDIYPENDLGIAYAIQHEDGIEPYRHYEDGWHQVQGGRNEGLFITLPEVAARDVVEIVYGPQFEGNRALKLWVLFDVVAGSDPDQDPRRGNLGLGTDVVIPLRGLAVTHVLSAN